jgi:hypothetical protein
MGCARRPLHDLPRETDAFANINTPEAPQIAESEGPWRPSCADLANINVHTIILQMAELA